MNNLPPGVSDTDPVDYEIVMADVWCDRGHYQVIEVEQQGDELYIIDGTQCEYCDSTNLGFDEVDHGDL